MRKIKFLVLGMAICSMGAMAQQDSSLYAQEYGRQVLIYQAAQAFADPEMEKSALYNLLSLNPNDANVLRSLAMLYYSNGRFTSSALVGMDFLKKYPGDSTALEVCALSYEQLRLYDRAVEYYEQLYLLKDDVYLLYQITYLQYVLKRYNEAKNNIGILESRITDDNKISLTKADKQVQEVPMMAALKNLAGLVALDEGNKEGAKAYFNEALKIAPDFEAARLSLEGVDKE